MSDYISREAALESFGDAPMWTGYYEPYSFEVHMALTSIAKVIRETITQVPAADVEPVRHGQWLRTDDDWNSLTTFQCTVCGEEFCFEIDEDIELLNYNYCPNCGAKMRAGDDDNEFVPLDEDEDGEDYWDV